MSDLQTNFNVAPYFDDYNEDSQYYRILFRPSVAVQARELTQIQTMLQKQISRFGNSIYKDGSIIEGCTYSTYAGISQMKFKDSNTTTLDFGLLTTNTSEIANSYLLVSNTTGCRAIIFRAFSGSESAVDQGSLDTNRAYLIYISTGIYGGADVPKFSDTREQIDVYHYSNQSKLGPLNTSPYPTGNYMGSIYTLASNSSVNAYGTGYGLRIAQGTIYQKGFFQKSLPANIIIREHVANAAGIKVGFDTNEYIVTEVTDPSLNDNAIGSYNYSAPGAHRLKLVPTPVFYDASNNQVSIPKNFLSILEFDGGDGRVVVNYPTPQYSDLMDLIAKRTFEESGNYIVRPFSVDVIAHESNTQSFYYNVGAGIAYVDGYRVEYLSPRKIEVKRAIDTESQTNKVSTLNMGNYAKIQNFAGTIDVQNLKEVMLIKGAQEVLGNNLPITQPIGGLNASTWVGNANIRAVLFDPSSGALKGTPNAQFDLFLTNIKMNAGKNFYTDVDAIYATDSNYGYVFGDFIKDSSGRILLYDTSLTNLLFDTGISGVKRLTSNTGVNSSTFVYRNTLTAGLTQTGSQSQATFTIPGPDTFNYGVGYLNDISSLDVNLTFAQDTTGVAFATNLSKAGYDSLGANVTAPAAFTAGLIVGQALKLTNTTSSSTGYVTIRRIDNANSIYVTPASSVPAVGVLQGKPFYKQGTAVNFIGSGNTVYVNSPTSITVNLALGPDTTTYSLNGQIQIARNTAQPIEKVVNKNSAIKINCSTHSAGAAGPWCLGMADVYSIANVHVGSVSGTQYAITNPDQQSWFYIQSGQTDDTYKLSYLALNPQYAGNITNQSTLLVKVNNFTANVTSSKAGFFSVDSYQIDDLSPGTNPSAIATAQIPLYTDTHSLQYDLRNFLDFRPVFANTANITTDITQATINPLDNNSTYVKGTGNGLAIEPESNFNCNIEYYLPRQDTLVINKDASLSAKQGQPSLRPLLPSLNKTGLQVANIFVPPYPSLTFTESE
jgi:hypothetical protein